MKSAFYNLTLRVLFLTTVSIPVEVFAETATLSETTSVVSPFIKMFFGLIAVLMLIFLVGWLARKMKLMQTVTGGYQIRNLASLALTTREKVCLIEVGGKQVLVGLAPGRVNKLYVFDEQIEIDSEQLDTSNDNPFAKHFRNALGVSNTGTVIK